MNRERLDDLRAAINAITPYDQCTYSGRGMYGRQSQLAFVVEIASGSAGGKALKALGLACDAMGLGRWVYYLP
jgi:hypothetical protein